MSLRERERGRERQGERIIICNIIRTTWHTELEKSHYRNKDTETVLVSDMTYFGYILCEFSLNSRQKAARLW